MQFSKDARRKREARPPAPGRRVEEQVSSFSGKRGQKPCRSEALVHVLLSSTTASECCASRIRPDGRAVDRTSPPQPKGLGGVRSHRQSFLYGGDFENGINKVSPETERK